MEKFKNHSLQMHIALLFGLVATVFIAVGIYQVFATGGTDAITGSLTVNHYCVFTTNVDSGGITFGGATGLNPASNTMGIVNTIAITDTGNLGSNILTSGSNWNYLSNSFNVGNSIWSSNTANNLWGPDPQSYWTG